MVLTARPRAPDGPFHVGLKLDATLLEGFLRDVFSCEGGLYARRRLRGEAERHPEEDSDYRDYETWTAPLSGRFPRTHVIPFPLVVLALLYRLPIK